MFVGKEGLRGFVDRGMSIEMDEIPVRDAPGYKVRLVYLARGNKYIPFFQTNIPQEIWNMEESDVLRKAVLGFINPKGKDFSLGLEEDTNNVALRFPQPLQDNLLSLPQI